VGDREARGCSACCGERLGRLRLGDAGALLELFVLGAIERVAGRGEARRLLRMLGRIELACELLAAGLRFAELVVVTREPNLEIGDHAILWAADTGDRRAGFGFGELALQTVELTAQRLLARLALFHL